MENNNNNNNSSKILKSAEFESSYNETSSIRKYSTIADINDHNYSTTGERTIMKKNSSTVKDDDTKLGTSQPFPNIEESGETMHRSESNNNFENATYSLIMDTSFNINIFSVTSNSSNIYSSESTDLSVKNSQSIEVKLNIESSEIKKIIFDQIFRELYIPEELWTSIFKKMNTFNDEYIEYFKRIYDIYINPKGIVPMKLKSNTSKSIGLKISKSEYSYDMFFPVRYSKIYIYILNF